MWATTLYDLAVPAGQWGTVLGASLAAGLFDARSRRIPNWLTGSLLLGGLVHACFVGGASGLADSVAACLLLALPYVLLYALAGGGAGDAKLMGALGSWLGLVYGTGLLLGVCVAGIGMAVAWAAFAGRLRAVMESIGGLAMGVMYPLVGAGSFRDIPSYLPSVKDGQTMPYGLAIFAGVVLSGAGFLLWQP
jgi:Flp pilus assembly protein protease CpaA